MQLLEWRKHKLLGMLMKGERLAAASACDHAAVTINKINPASEPCSDAAGKFSTTCTSKDFLKRCRSQGVRGWLIGYFLCINIKRSHFLSCQSQT
jgi:hypothetical protein